MDEAYEEQTEGELVMSNIEEAQPTLSEFERLKHADGQEQEYWSARELYPKLDYKHWQDFHRVLQEAMTVYRNSGGSDVDTIFRKVSKDVPRKSGRPYTITDYHLTRHACYLTVLSANGSKPIISLAKSYFAVTTRLHEIAQTQEDQLRLERREVLREQNRTLAFYANQAGVTTTTQYATFWNSG